VRTILSFSMYLLLSNAHRHNLLICTALMTCSVKRKPRNLYVGVSFNVARVSCNVARVSCNVAGVSCNAARLFCNVARVSFNVADVLCNVARVS